MLERNINARITIGEASPKRQYRLQYRRPIITAREYIRDRHRFSLCRRTWQKLFDQQNVYLHRSPLQGQAVLIIHIGAKLEQDFQKFAREGIC